MAKKSKSHDKLLQLIRATRHRTWVVNPVTQVVQSKKKKINRNACRTKNIEKE